MTAKEIGRKLRISPNTVAMHLRLARQKLDAAKIIRNAASDESWHSADRGDWLSWHEMLAGLILFLAGLLTCLALLAALTLYLFPQFRLHS
jgi:hypothetical protein